MKLIQIVERNLPLIYKHTINIRGMYRIFKLPSLSASVMIVKNYFVLKDYVVIDDIGDIFGLYDTNLKFWIEGGNWMQFVNYNPNPIYFHNDFIQRNVPKQTIHKYQLEASGNNELST